MLEAYGGVTIQLRPQVDDAAVIKTNPACGADEENHRVGDSWEEAGKLDSLAFSDHDVLKRGRLVLNC